MPKPLYRTSVCAAVDTILCKAPQEQPEKQEGDLLAGKRILVVEDNDLNREITQELLHMQGMVTQCAINGKEAVQAYLSAPQGHFDAILMDVQMPVMNGYEAAKQIRLSGQADAQTLPIIATTANAFRSDISAALAAGMNAHVSKPIDIQQLCQVLKEQLGSV